MIRPADLARLSPEREAEAKRAVFVGVSDHCVHEGPVVEGDYCCEDCERITDDVLRFISQRGFLLLHEDDVTVDEGWEMNDGQYCDVARLVTSWREVSE